MQEIMGEASIMGSSASSGILLGTTKYVEQISADAAPVQNSTFLGLAAGMASAFAIMIPNHIIDPLTSGAIIFGSGLTGVLAFGATTAAISLNSKIRKALKPLGSSPKEPSIGSAWKLMMARSETKTSVALGRNTFGEDMQAVVTSGFNNVKVEYIALPDAIEVWDKSMETLKSVYEISPNKEVAVPMSMEISA
jgi:hypothetical protein